MWKRSTSADKRISWNYRTRILEETEIFSKFYTTLFQIGIIFSTLRTIKEYMLQKKYSLLYFTVCPVFIQEIRKSKKLGYILTTREKCLNRCSSLSFIDPIVSKGFITSSVEYTIEYLYS